MSNLLSYYERFFKVLKDDVSLLLQVPVLDERDHKRIKLLLEMAGDCEVKIEGYTGLTDDWDKLRAGTKEKIMALIQADITERTQSK